MPPLAAKTVLNTFAVFEIVQISPALIQDAIDRAVRNTLSFWDALIIAAAASAGLRVPSSVGDIRCVRDAKVERAGTSCHHNGHGENGYCSPPQTVNYVEHGASAFPFSYSRT